LVENLALYFFYFLLTEKLNHMAKTLYLSSQNTVDWYKSFCSVSKFLITNTTFFPSWNICSIIPLIFITYLALVHNYNTIKCICFINPRRRAGNHLVESKEQCISSVMRWARDCREDSPDMTINIQDALQRMKKIKDKFIESILRGCWLQHYP